MSLLVDALRKIANPENDRVNEPVAAAIAESALKALAAEQGLISSDLLRDVRCEIPDLIENVGEVSAMLYEAIEAVDENNLKGARVVAGDTLESLTRLESTVSEMASNVVKWIQWVEEGA
jgi:hypothetical protein